jgi:hypothetical protein
LIVAAKVKELGEADDSIQGKEFINFIFKVFGNSFSKANPWLRSAS